MANFCPSCGAALGNASRFCPACGQAVASAAAGVPAAPAALPGSGASPSAPAAPVSGGGSNAAVKILFAILGIICLFALVAAGSCFYIGYRVKQRAAAISKTYGMDSAPYRGRKDACGFVSKSDVSAAFGEPVQSVNDHGSTCEYVFAGDGSRRMALQFTWEGGTMLMKLSHGAMKSVAGMDTFTPISGIGDEAYLQPMGSGLMMRKGDVMVNIDLRAAGLNAEGAKTIAAKIAGGL